MTILSGKLLSATIVLRASCAYKNSIIKSQKKILWNTFTVAFFFNLGTQFRITTIVMTLNPSIGL